MKEQLEQVKIFYATPSLSNFEIRKHCGNKPKFNNVYSKKNLSKIKDGHIQSILMSMSQ